MRLLKNYFYSSFYQIFLIIVPLITAPYLSRVLLPYNYGINSYVLTISQLFSSIGLIGLNSYGSRQIAYDRDDNKRLSNTFYEILILRLIMMVITCIIYFLCCQIDKYRVYLIIQIIWLASTFIDITWFFNGLEEFKITVFRSFIIKTLNVICIFVFIHQSSDLYLYILINGLMQLLGFLIMLPGLKKNIIVPEFKQLNIIRHIIPSLKIFLPQVTTLLFLQFDKIMIEIITNTTEYVGFYDQAEKIVKIPLALITSLGNVTMPHIANAYAKKEHNYIVKLIHISIRIVMMACCPMMFGIIAIAPDLIPWFLGDEYNAVILGVQMLSSIILFCSLSTITTYQYYIAQNKTKILTFTYICGAIINLIINLVTIPNHGFYGAILGTIAAEGVIMLLQYIFVFQKLNIYKMIPYFFKYFILSFIMYIIVSFFANYLSPTFMSTCLEIFFGIVIYLILLLLTKEKIHEIFNLVKNKFD